MMIGACRSGAVGKRRKGRKGRRSRRRRRIHVFRTHTCNEKR